MKKIKLFFCSFLLWPFLGFSQSTNANAKVYLLEDFTEGKALMKNGSVETAEFNYDPLNQSIIFKKGKEVMTLTGLDEIDTVYIDNKKFVALNNVAYEVAASAPVSLLVSYSLKSKSLTATTDHNGTSTQSTNQVSNTVSDAYMIRRYQGKFGYTIINQYWLKKGDRLYKANTEKQIINMFPGKSNEINTYLENNKPDFNKVSHVGRLIKFCNTL